MHNISAHQLPQYYQLQFVSSTDWTASATYTLQTNTYQNIAKLLTQLINIASIVYFSGVFFLNK